MALSPSQAGAHCNYPAVNRARARRGNAAIRRVADRRSRSCCADGDGLRRAVRPARGAERRRRQPARVPVVRGDGRRRRRNRNRMCPDSGCSGVGDLAEENDSGSSHVYVESICRKLRAGREVKMMKPTFQRRGIRR
jgi:hypothetical protein